MSAPLLHLEGVSRVFAPHLKLSDRIAKALGGAVDTRAVQAVDGVTLSLAKGEAVGLVGESGCGKSTLGRLAAGILSPSKGVVTLDGRPVRGAGRNAGKLMTRIQTVFQDPFASLNPRIRVGDTIAEGPIAHGLVTKPDAPALVARWLTTVGLDPAFATRFPHQFSGGQRQRIAIARALAMEPEILVCDEPVASLDVSIQAQIVNLFLKLKRELGLTLLFISHDLGVVRHISDRIAIMYLGRIVEEGPAEVVTSRPRHPYTEALLASVPRLVIEDDATIDFRPIEGELPSPLSPPSGCHFHLRCPKAEPGCRTEVPALREIDGRRVACVKA